MATYRNQTLIKQMNNLHVDPGCLAIWGLGQMGVALKATNQRIIYIDPVLSDVIALRYPELGDRFKRAFPPPLQPSEITNAAYVLCTHEHLDHTDPLTLGPLAEASPESRFIISGWAHPILDEAGIAPSRRIVPIVLQQIDLDGIKITAVPAAHYTLECDDLSGCRFISYLIEWNGITFFHSGDTLLYPGYLQTLNNLARINVAMLAVNGRDAYRESFDVLGNLLPTEAVWLAKELGIDMLIGGHNDLFLWNTIRSGDLADAVRQHNSRQKFVTLQPGELFYYIA
jgi:L-ascorbate 6-phosphate lactonase